MFRQSVVSVLGQFQFNWRTLGNTLSQLLVTFWAVGGLNSHMNKQKNEVLKIEAPSLYPLKRFVPQIRKRITGFACNTVQKLWFELK
eukprot:6482194-Amphidinium_carterae.1